MAAARAKAKRLAQPPQDEFNIEKVVARLLEGKGCLPQRRLQVTEKEIKTLCQKSKGVFLSQPILLELSAPVVVCGDLHGNYADLLRIFERMGHPPLTNYLFLGNYVDRGEQALEVLLLLFAYKIKHPENVFLLRGNHECASINRYGKFSFYDECRQRLSVKMWKTFCDIFNCLPLAALIENKILCCHGGLSPQLESLAQIMRIPRPTDVPDTGVICDLLWSDPRDELSGWEHSERGVSYEFGADVIDSFVNRFDIELIVRSHQVVMKGFQFSAQRRLVTLFSSSNHLGEFANKAAVMRVDEELGCTFNTLAPELRCGSATRGSSARRVEARGVQ